MFSSHEKTVLKIIKKIIIIIIIMNFFPSLLKISTFVFLLHHPEFFYVNASCSNRPSILFYASAANVIVIYFHIYIMSLLSFNIIIWYCTTNRAFKIDFVPVCSLVVLFL